MLAQRKTKDPQNNYNKKQLKTPKKQNGKVDAWQQARVLSQIIKSKFYERYRYVLFRLKYTPSRKFNKLKYMQILYYRKLKQNFLDLVIESNQKQIVKNNNKIQRTNRFSIVFHKLDKIYSKRVSNSYKKIIKYKKNQQLISKSLQQSISNCNMISQTSTILKAFNNIKSSIKRQKYAQIHFHNIHELLKIKQHQFLTESIMKMYHYNLSQKYQQTKNMQRNTKNKQFQYNSSRNQYLLEQRRLLTELKSQTKRVQSQKYQIEGQIKRNRSLKYGQQRTKIRHQQREYDILVKQFQQNQAYYSNIQQIYRNRQILNSLFRQNLDIRKKYNQIYTSLQTSHKDYQLNKQKFRQQSILTKSLSLLNQFHIHQGLKLNQQINKYENVNQSELTKTQNYLQAVQQNKTLKLLLQQLIKYQLLKNNQLKVQNNIQQLQQNFQQLFQHTQNQDSEVARKQTARTSMFSLQSERFN